jgi:hypothetical protein
VHVVGRCREGDVRLIDARQVDTLDLSRVPRSVLISGAVAAEITTPLVPLGEHVLRGIAAPCAVFTLPDA